MLPGSFFVLWGLWWLLAVSRAASRSSRRDFVARSHWPLPLLSGTCAHFLEAQLKTLLPLLGVLVELYLHPGDVRFRHPVDAAHRWDQHSAVNWQHAAMYLAFALSGAFDWLTAQCSATMQIPAGLNWAAMCGAFCMECVLFVFHLRMQSGLVADLHVLLVALVLACATAVAAAGSLPNSITASMLVGYLMLAQGSWFLWQARILYGAVGHRWDLNDVDGGQMMLPVVFVFNMLACGALALAVYMVVAAHPRLVGLKDKASPSSTGGALWDD